MNKKAIIRIILLTAGILLAAVLIELIMDARAIISPKITAAFEAAALEEVPDPTGGRERYQHNADVVTPVSGTARQSYEDPVYLRAPLDNAYYNRLVLTTDGSENLPYTVLLDTYSIYGQEKYTEKDDVAVAVLNGGVTEFSDKLENLYLMLDRSNVEKLRDLSVENRFVFHWQRFLLFLALTTAIGILVFCGQFLTKRLDLVFLILGLLFGVSYTFSHGITLNSWDEQVHYTCIYQMSFAGEAERSDAYEAYAGLAVPGGDTTEELTGIATWADSVGTATGTMQKDYPYTTVFGRVGYIFQSLGMAIARLIGLSFSATIYVSNLCNMLCYVLITALAIRLCKIGKQAMFFLGLLPIQFVLACSFSYDAFVNAFLMLGYALFTREYVSEEPLSWKRVIPGLVVLSIGIIPKAVYFPVILLYLFLPKRKFADKKQRSLLFAIVIAAALALAMTFVLPTLMAGSGGTDLYSDPRRSAANASEQLKMIFSEPFKYARLLFSNIFNWQVPYYLGPKVWTNFAYAGKYTGTGLYLIPVFLCFLSITQGSMDNGENGTVALPEDRKLLGLLPMKIGTVLTALLSECLIWTALYLAFNPVGAERIAGVQGRYLIPFAYLTMLLFYNKKIRCHLQLKTYNRIVIAGAAYIAFQAAYMIYFGDTWYQVI